MRLVRGARRLGLVAGAIGILALFGPSASPPPAPESAYAASLPSGFQETVVFSGLTAPTTVRFSPNGRVFVAEKSGVVKVFDSLTDTSATVFADLNANVYNFWDRGLLGLEVHPQFPSQPYVYALYSHDAAIGGQAPRFGTAGVYSDPCPTPPGATQDGCVTSGRLSRLTATPSGGSYVMTGSEQVLVEDWCAQFQTHSVGTVAFGADGALYASGGEGAGATFTDYGQTGNPLNPCGDPPGGVGAVLTPPTAEGGALRSQDLRTSGDPVGLDGTIIRVDPTTGAGWPGNPFAGSSDANARRVIAYGLRNPFRFALRPGTSEPWIADVGGIDWEEINRLPDPGGAAENFGWPCYEGAGPQSSFDAANFTICENLYAQTGAVTGAYHAYNHASQVVPGESCPTGSSSISGMAFEPASAQSVYPAAFQGALFFADYSRDCIWAMKKIGGSLPSPAAIETFVAGASNPVGLEFGPDGNLYYVDIEGGTVRRVEVSGSTPPPPGTSFLSDLTWTSMSNHCGPVEKDRSNGNCAAGDGLTMSINGTSYTKGLGGHATSDVSYFLGGNCTRFKASIGIDDEVPGTNGLVTFQVYADSTLAFQSTAMNGTSPTQLVDVSVQGASQLRLVLDAGADANWDHADWALARVECGGGDTTPPTIIAQAPSPGATGIALSVSPTATFSEAMDPATLTSTTFTLTKQGTSTPVTASVSYAGQTATLDPTASLEASTQYAATVKGGSSGAKDLAGNALASDVSWSFTTTAAANLPPVPVIDTPASSLTWKVGDLVPFTGHATDPEQGTLSASALSWSLVIQHCPSNCHSHTIQSWSGVSGASFNAPDHEYPAYLELRLTATDGGGLASTTTLRLDPQTVALTFASSPSGLLLSVNASSQATPFMRTVIVGSTNSVSAFTPQSLGGTTYSFSSWSDGGAQTHNVVAPASPATYTGTYAGGGTSPPVNTVLPVVSGQARVGFTLVVSNGTWTGSPQTFGYQWILCDKRQTQCNPISDATGSSYLITSADIGFRLRATVTATNTAGSASATSNTTSPVKRT